MDMNIQKTGKQAFNGAAKTVDNVADDIKVGTHQAAAKMNDKFQEMEASLATRYVAWKDTASEGYDTAIDTVKKYPLYAVLGATGIGLLAGFLISRRRN